MKKAFLFLIFFVALALNAHGMKRKGRASSKAIAQAKTTVIGMDFQATEKKFDADDNQRLHEMMIAHEKQKNEQYPSRFYYVPGVPRVLAEKYCCTMERWQRGFSNAHWDCANYEDGKCFNASFRQKMQEVRPFLVEYSTLIIEKAISLRTSDLSYDEIGPECEHAIRLLYEDQAIYEHFQNEWKKIIEISLRYHGSLIALPTGVHE